MNNFDELKNLWQSQEPVRLQNESFDKTIPGVIQKLQSFDKRQFRINMIKSIAVIMILAPMVMVVLENTSGITGLLGMGIITAGILWFLSVYWKKQFSVNRLKLGERSLVFIEDSITQLKEQNKIFNFYFPLFGTVLLLGINVIYLGLLSTEKFYTKLYLHTGMSLMIMLFLFAGYKIRMYRIKKEWQPLIDELTEIKNDLTGENNNEM